MNNKDLISQYINIGLGIQRYQFDRLSFNDKKTYLRSLQINMKHSPHLVKFYYGELPEEAQLAVVKESPRLIKDLKNPYISQHVFSLEKNIYNVCYLIY